MPSQELVTYTAGLVQKDFFFEELLNYLPLEEDLAIQELKRLLAQRIAHMLDSDFELLMQIFYRIDLKEQSVKEAIALAESPSMRLAELVLERELQKARTRLLYRNRQ